MGEKDSINVLVTGAGGFLGSHLVKSLAMLGFSVIAGTSKSGIAFQNTKNIEVRQIDWANSDSIRQSCKDVNVVIHAAGMNFEDCEMNPNLANHFHGEKTNELIQSAVLQYVEKFIYISTVHVYANPLVGTFNEKSNPTADHIYATSHLLGENYLKEANLQNRISGKIMRLANTFGKPVHTNALSRKSFIESICKSAVEDNSIVIKSFAGIKRDFIPIEFACNQIGKVIEKYDLITQEIVNISSGESASLETVASKVVLELEKLNDSRKSPTIQYLGGRGKGQELRIYNTQKAMIGSLPKEAVERAIRNILIAETTKE